MYKSAMARNATPSLNLQNLWHCERLKKLPEPASKEFEEKCKRRAENGSAKDTPCRI